MLLQDLLNLSKYERVNKGGLATTNIHLRIDKLARQVTIPVIQEFAQDPFRMGSQRQDMFKLNSGLRAVALNSP